MGFGVLRCEGEGATVVRHRVVDPAGNVQQGAEIVLGLGVLRIDRHRAAERGDRGVELALRGERETEVVVRAGDVWIEGDRLAEVRHGLVGLTTLKVKQRHGVVPRSRAGAQRRAPEN